MYLYLSRRSTLSPLAAILASFSSSFTLRVVRSAPAMLVRIALGTAVAAPPRRRAMLFSSASRPADITLLSGWKDAASVLSTMRFPLSPTRFFARSASRRLRSSRISTSSSPSSSLVAATGLSSSSGVTTGDLNLASLRCRSRYRIHPAPSSGFISSGILYASQPVSSEWSHAASSAPRLGTGLFDIKPR